MEKLSFIKFNLNDNYIILPKLENPEFDKEMDEKFKEFDKIYNKVKDIYKNAIKELRKI